MPRRISVALSGWSIIFLCTACGYPDDAIRRRSPNNQFEAVIVYTQGGGAAGWSGTTLYLSRAARTRGKRMLDGRFSAEDVRWLDDRTVVVNTGPNQLVWMKSNEWVPAGGETSVELLWRRSSRNVEGATDR